MTTDEQIDPLARRDAVAESIRRKTAQLAAKSEPEPNPAQREADDELAEARRVHAEIVGKASAGESDGGARAQNTTKPLLDAIAEAEQAGDWKRSLDLKSRQLKAVADARRWGTAPDYSHQPPPAA